MKTENENIRFLKPFLRGLPIIILAAILSILAAKKYLNYVTPMYESTAKLKLADAQEGVPSANLYKDFDVFTTANKINTEIEVLKSTSLIEKTIAQIPFSTEIYRKGDIQSVELYNNSPIIIHSTFSSDNNYDKRFDLKIISMNDFELQLPNSTKIIKGKFGTPISIDKGKLLLTLNQKFIQSKPKLNIIDAYEFEFLSKQKLVTKINKNLDIVSVDKDVPVIRINYKSSVPEKASVFVNTLAQMYIQDYIENKYGAANTTVEFLKNEIEDAHAKLTHTEAKIQQFRDHHNIINIPQETETDLRKIAQLKIQKSNIKMNLNAAKDLNNQIAKSKGNFQNIAPNFEAFNDLLSTEMVKNVKQLQAEKKELLNTFTPEHEKVKVIDAKIKDLNDYQIESIKNTERNLQVKYNDLNSDISVAEQVFVGLPGKERMLTVLNREFNLYEKSYNFLNEKRIDAEIAKAAKISFHKVITPGEVSKVPVSPVRSIIIIVAALLGLLSSIIIIYLIHFLKAKVNDIYTIEKNSETPIATTIPFINNENQISNQFLKNIIELELKGILNENNSMTISSYDNPNQHQFISKNLFLNLEKQQRKVLMIDVAGNLSNENNKHILDFSDEKYLALTKNQIEELIKQKQLDYDLCIINNDAIKNNALAVLFMNISQHNLLVLDSRKTAEKTIHSINLLKEEYQIPNLWFVLNKVGYNPSIFKNFISKIKK